MLKLRACDIHKFTIKVNGVWRKHLHTNTNSDWRKYGDKYMGLRK